LKHADLHWILNRSLSELHAVVVDHTLDGDRLASRALPSCLDLQNLPNNDKEKVINCDENYLFAPHSLLNFSIILYIKFIQIVYM
jgi:hypothetical protein